MINVVEVIIVPKLIAMRGTTVICPDVILDNIVIIMNMD